MGCDEIAHFLAVGIQCLYRTDMSNDDGICNRIVHSKFSSPISFFFCLLKVSLLSIDSKYADLVHVREFCDHHYKYSQCVEKEHRVLIVCCVRGYQVPAGNVWSYFQVPKIHLLTTYLSHTTIEVLPTIHHLILPWKRFSKSHNRPYVLYQSLKNIAKNYKSKVLGHY